MLRRTLIILLMFSILLVNSACSLKKEDAANDGDKSNFAIYLVKDTDASKAIKEDINKLVLEDEPIITDQNISSYVWSEHRINLIKDEKLISTLDEKLLMKVPVHGKPFVVVCSGERIYLGMFWTLLSSLSAPRCPTIMDDFYDGDSFKIYFAYEDNDIRNDNRIYKTFEELGKLK